MRRALRLFLAMSFMAGAGRLAAGTVDAVRSGAVGDGSTLNTLAIQRAIDALSAEGGGILEFGAGRYLTGTIQIKDNVTLDLDAQAVLLGSLNPVDYRNLDPFMAGDGIPQGHALIVADGARNVGIMGAGTIDGQGPALKAAQSPYRVRPFLIRWIRCNGVTVRDVHLTRSGAWTLDFFQTRHASVEHVTIRTRNSGLINNDGIDLDSCEDVRVRDCDIDTEDDALCLKATSPVACRNIAASGCKLSTQCNAIKLGTESLGDFEDISISNCQVRNTDMAGITLSSVDGSHLSNVTVSDITMDGVTVPICVRLGARLKVFRAGDTAKPPGTLTGVTIRNVHAVGARQIGLLINGIAGHPIENLTLENIRIELPGGGTAQQAQLQLEEKPSSYPQFSMFGTVMPASGLYLRHVHGVILKNVHTTVLSPDARPAAVFVDVQDVTPADFLSRQGSPH